MTRAASLLLAVTLTACHSVRDTPGTVTPEQDRQLNEAATALDANAMSANTTATGDAP